MGSVLRLVTIFALVSAVASPAIAQQGPAGDRDDQIVITGCVVRADQKLSGPRTFLVWSKGDVYLDSAITDIKPAERARGAVGTSGKTDPIFYWIDDEDDLMKHAGKRVEIVGELSDELDEGEIDVQKKGAFIEVEFEWEGKDVIARVPSQWLAPETPAKDVDFDIAVRRVDVEKVNILGSCD